MSQFIVLLFLIELLVFMDLFLIKLKGVGYIKLLYMELKTSNLFQPEISILVLHPKATILPQLLSTE